MRKFYFLACLIVFSSFCGFSQKEGAYSPKKYVSIEVQAKPPVLNIVDGSIAFVDANGNNAIDANESCFLRFSLENSGYAPAVGCSAIVRMRGSIEGVSIKNNHSLETIAVNTVHDISIPITSNMNTVDGILGVTVEILEPKGFGTEPFEIRVPTKAFIAPYVVMVDKRVTSEKGANLQKKVPFDLQVLIQNTQYGEAENVKISLGIPANVMLLDGAMEHNVSKMSGGKQELIDYSLIVNNMYEGTEIPITIHIQEKYGKYAQDTTFSLSLNQSLSRTKITVEAEQQTDFVAIQKGSLTADVDKNIPQATFVNNDVYVVVISNENYRNDIDAVSYALNDGNVFAEYCQKALGIPRNQIHHISDATKNEMLREIDWVVELAKLKPNVSKIIFYYAGHGVPDDASKDAFLLPVDSYGNSIQTALKLDEVYSTLSQANAKQVLVLLDACFSGTQRGQGMLVAARGVRVASKVGMPKGNMVVISAATGDETAYPYVEKQHGMFTYFLLKKLQETSGNVQLGPLSEYLFANVQEQALLNYSRTQSPTVNAAEAVQYEWRTMSLK